MTSARICVSMSFGWPSIGTCQCDARPAYESGTLVSPGRSTSVRLGTCGEKMVSVMGLSDTFCGRVGYYVDAQHHNLAVANEPVRLALNLPAHLVEVGEGLRGVKQSYFPAWASLVAEVLERGPLLGRARRRHARHPPA